MCDPRTDTKRRFRIMARRAQSSSRTSLSIATLLSCITTIALIAGSPPKHAIAESIASTPLKAARGGGASLFDRLSADQTGIDFEVPLDFDHPKKQVLLHGFAGSGICIGDYDADGRPDIYLVSHGNSNKLYRQVDDFRFEDVTDRAGVAGSGWGAGATFVDIDNDGDLDLYVCVYDAPNLLYINRGDGTFTESAHRYGLDFRGASVMSAFADIDNDGDLDMYLLTNRRYSAPGRARRPRVIKVDGKLALQPGFEESDMLQHRIVDGETQHFIVLAGQRDHLYRNNGNGTFTDISEQAGITGNDAGNGVVWWDYNNDSRPDLYVCNDFWGPDRLYRNNGDGTFTDVIRSTLPHTPWFSMGADLGDINNDGLIDFLAADMSSTTHFMAKLTMGAMSNSRWFLESAEPRQYMRNALYLSTGTARCMEIAYLAGLDSTDWTWSVRFGDLDNDGKIDVFFTNGTLNHSFNADFAAKQAGVNELSRKLKLDAAAADKLQWDLYRKQPPRREANLAFRNLGDLRFERVGRRWGLEDVTLSYAASLADLDRDGDLDLVVGNLGEPVGIYRNNSVTGHRVLIRLIGTRSNRFGLGSKLTLQTDSGTQARELTLTRGFMSADEPIVHFGLGDDPIIRQLTVRWPGGHEQTFENLEADRLYVISEPRAQATGLPPPPNDSPPPTQFREIAATIGLIGTHKERPFDDYARQPLLPNKLSQLGPGMAWGDADGDGDDDLFVGGAAGQAGTLYVSDGRGSFTSKDQGPWRNDAASEDMGILWFDADADGDMDLYVASGGVEADVGDPNLRDRLYLNNGHGGFVRAPDGTLPAVADSSSVVTAADFDQDGDLDLFVGSRVIPGQYPLTPNSRLLRNDGGRFIDATDELAPGLRTVGLVTGALWSDADGDGRVDLLVTLEWGPISFWRNTGNGLKDATESAGLAEELGWWNGITATDIDRDGDMDYVVTNVGLNTKYHARPDHPELLYYGDMDQSGIKRIVEAKYERETLYPRRGRSCSSNAMPFITSKFPTYESYARAPLTDIYPQPCLSTATTFRATRLESVLLINQGNARFDLIPLPVPAQIAPGFGVVATDFDGDANPDVCIAQNFFSPQPETGRSDGGLSIFLRGRVGQDPPFILSPVTPPDSGLVVPGDAKAMTICDLNADAIPDLAMTQNDAPLLAFINSAPASADRRFLSIRLRSRPGNPTAVGARVTLFAPDGQRQTAEVHAGSGYLSQSTAALFFALAPNRTPHRLEVRWPNSQTSTHAVPAKATRLEVEQPSD